MTDMNYYFKSVKQLMFFCFINLFLLISFNVSGSECGVLTLRANRSSGISIEANKCEQLPNISRGTIFDISAKGRLWLKSNPAKPKKNEFQMICQNKAGISALLEFSDELSPWLSQTKLSNCTGWVDNKLSCDSQNGEKSGVYCVLAYVKEVTGNRSKQIERTTSVKMRGIKLLQSENTAVSSDKQKIPESIKQDLDLCKKLSGIKQDVKVAWTVGQNNEIKEIEVTPTEKLNDLSECVKAVVTTSSYPTLSEKVTFNSIF